MAVISGDSFVLKVEDYSNISPAPVYVGTGNGVLASIGSTPGAPTETILITCTNAALPAAFSVVGSVSGSVGTAVAGVAFVSKILTCTITAGGTAFIVGDHWTVTVTAVGFLVVANFNAFAKKSQNPEQRFPIFGNPVPLTQPGPREQTFTVAGFLDLSDAGQAILRASESQRYTPVVQVLFDGVNGYSQRVRVGGFGHDAKPEGIQAISYEMTGVEAPLIVGTGPIQ